MTYSDSIEQLMMRAQAPLLVRSTPGLIAALTFNYHVMIATEMLLNLASELAFGPTFEGDQALGRYFAKHADEEREHPAWLKADIEELGGRVGEPDHMAACIAGSQYYYLNHLGPVPFLGYLAAMEFRPTKVEAVELISQMTGGRGMRTLRHHAVADIEHGRELAAVIERYRTERLIAYNAAMTHSLYTSYVRQRVEAAQPAMTEASHAMH